MATRSSAGPRTRAPRKAAGTQAVATLGEYSAKRAFELTPEPAPELANRAGPLLFVVQQHSARQLHYDFRLELDGVLKSWAVPKGPSLDPSEKRLAVQTEDHPYDYASFEGVIPPGQYGAGEVIVWDCGVYTPDEGGETWFHDRSSAERLAREGLEKGKLSFQLRGEKLKGSFALVRSSDTKNWFLLKHRDRFAGNAAVADQARSVLSGLKVGDLKAHPVQRIPAARLVPAGEPEDLPAKLAPMLADARDAPFAEPGWTWEPKLDGYRVLAFIDADGAKLRSRRGLDLTAVFPGIAGELGGQSVPGMILDGEVVAFDAGGRPSFGALQERVQLKTAQEIAVAERGAPAVFYCFDLLHFAGLDVRGASYADRRRWLKQCLLPSPRVQLVHASDDGVALYAAALANGFEGVVAKRDDSRYEAGRRSAAWLKIKSTQSADFVVGGYTSGKGSRRALGALLVGYWSGGRLHYAGHVGSGFDATTLGRLEAQVKPLQADACPFSAKPDLHSPTVWIKPVLVAEVKFAEWTKDGNLRAPVFLRFRDDVDARSVRRPRIGAAEEPVAAVRAGTVVEDVLRQLENPKSTCAITIGEHGLKVTHLDRVYWPADAALKQPALTKRDLLRYLAQVSPFMLPHLQDRPLTMIRMPAGILGERFYQKHWDQTLPAFVSSVRIFSESKDERQDYLLCNNLATLLWLAQSGTLEFHVWHSRVTPGEDAPGRGMDFSGSLAALEASVLNTPDYVVFDIDPYIYSGEEAPGAEPELNTVAFEKGKEVAFRLRELLKSMNLEAIVKTSGKTGLHVFVPIRRTLDFDAVRHVSELVGRHLVRLHPREVTVEWSVPKRTGKIFMDYNMNVRGKTLNAAYSPRGSPGAPVSMPLSWEDLARAHPLDFRIDNAGRRLARAGDPWGEALFRKQSLEGALDRTKA